VNFHILSVRASDSGVDPLFPQLDRHLMPVMDNTDGEVSFTEVTGLTVAIKKETRLHTVTGAAKLDAELWLTDRRLIVRCKNYDRVHWTVDNAIGSMVWGAGLETFDFAVTKLYHKVKSIGKAMVGHVYYPWIQAVLFQPGIGSRQRPGIRVVVATKLAGGGTRELYFSVSLSKRGDPKALAEDLVARCARWWTTHKTGLTSEQAERLKALKEVNFAIPQPGKMTIQKLPVFRYVASTNFSPPKGDPQETETPKAREQQLARQRQEDFRRSFRDTGRPPCELLGLATDTMSFTSSLGVNLGKSGVIFSEQTEKVLLNCVGYSYGSYLADSDTNVPSVDGATRPLYQGTSHLLITDRYVAVSCLTGKSAIGHVGEDPKRVFVAVAPLRRVIGVGIVSSETPTRLEPGMRIFFDDPTWGGMWLTKVNLDYDNDGARSTKREAPRSLGELALHLASGIVEVRGLEVPPQRNVEGGYVFDLPVEAEVISE
jgi:hypothetical protein